MLAYIVNSDLRLASTYIFEGLLDNASKSQEFLLCSGPELDYNE